MTRIQQINKKFLVPDTTKEGNRVRPIGPLLFSTEHLPNLSPPASQKDFLLSLFLFHSFIQSLCLVFFFFPTLDSQMVGSDLHAFA